MCKVCAGIHLVNMWWQIPVTGNYVLEIYSSKDNHDEQTYFL